MAAGQSKDMSTLSLVTPSSNGGYNRINNQSGNYTNTWGYMTTSNVFKSYFDDENPILKLYLNNAEIYTGTFELATYNQNYLWLVLNNDINHDDAKICGNINGEYHSFDLGEVARYNKAGYFLNIDHVISQIDEVKNPTVTESIKFTLKNAVNPVTFFNNKFGVTFSSCNLYIIQLSNNGEPYETIYAGNKTNYITENGTDIVVNYIKESNSTQFPNNDIYIVYDGGRYILNKPYISYEENMEIDIETLDWKKSY